MFVYVAIMKKSHKFERKQGKKDEGRGWREEMEGEML